MPSSPVSRRRSHVRPLSSAFAALLCLALALPTAVPAGQGGPSPTGSAQSPVASELTTALERIAADKLLTQAEASVEVVDLATGDTVYGHQASLGLNPASTMKVITAAAALDVLGPSYTWKTEVLTTGELGADGVLHGDLVVKGSGDPHLVGERLWKLVRDIRLEGVEKIDGDVIFDDGKLDRDHRLVGWDKREDLERGPSYFPPIGALSLNFNAVTLVVGPGKAQGQPARVRPETSASAYLDLVNETTTGSRGSRRTVAVEREVVGDRLRLVVTGNMPEGGEVRRYYRAIHDPTAHFAAAWMDLLAEQGITVSGTSRRADTPAGAEGLVEHVSPPLTAVLMDMNKYSNNFMAEQVLRTLGAESSGGTGTNAAGVAAVDAYLRRLGVDPSAYTLANGSGLSHEAKVPAHVLTRVLVDMARNPLVGSEFGATLAVAGYDGTLQYRLEDERGRVRGKTGTIGGVHCLAGYVAGEAGPRYAFAFLFNDLPGSSAAAQKVHDRFARALLAAATPADAATAHPTPPSTEIAEVRTSSRSSDPITVTGVAPEGEGD